MSSSGREARILRRLFRDVTGYVPRPWGAHTTATRLYVKRLSDIETGVLAGLIRAGLDDPGRRWPARPE